MKAFFEGVGSGHTAGVWQDAPEDHPQFREKYKIQLAKLAAKRKSEEMV
jgi:chlorophyllide a reductase subunit Y